MIEAYTPSERRLVKELSHYKSKCVDLMCENDELKQAISQRNQEIIKMIDDLYDYYKTKLDTKAQIPLIKLKQQLTTEGDQTK